MPNELLAFGIFTFLASVNWKMVVKKIDFVRQQVTLWKKVMHNS
jgi:hypothetical protein